MSLSLLLSNKISTTFREFTRAIFLIPILLLLQACSVAFGPKFSAYEPFDNTSAQIYVIRTEDGEAFKHISGGITGSYPDITVNGKNIGALKRGGYLVATAPAGEVDISTVGNINWWLAKQTVKLNVKPGQRYFINLNTGFAGLNTTGARQVGVSLTQTSEESALPILKQLSLSR